MKPLSKIKIEWSPKLAYCIGLIATDGNLSKDGRHLSLVSTDLAQIKLFMKCLGIKNKISLKKSGFAPGNTAHYVQFGDVMFYKFLLSIGLTPAKSKTIGKLEIPDKYFFDFLRGSFDGDGTFYSYWDKRWASSFMFYLAFISAGKAHLDWVRNQCERLLGVTGHMNSYATGGAYQLRYAKQDAIKIIKKFYYKCGPVRPISIQ